MTSLTFDSTRFGALEIDADAVIEFPAGLIGLGGVRYALVATDPGAPFAWLHSVELSDADADRVGTSDAAEIDVWVTVRAAAEPKDFSCNLRAPIVVWNGRGHQVINEAPDAPVRAALFAEATEAVQAA